MVVNHIITMKYLVCGVITITDGEVTEVVDISYPLDANSLEEAIEIVKEKFQFENPEIVGGEELEELPYYE